MRTTSTRRAAAAATAALLLAAIGTAVPALAAPTDPPPEPPAVEEPAPPEQGALSVVLDGRATDTNDDGRIGVGDTITFTATVTNTGDVTVTGVAAEGTRPDGAWAAADGWDDGELAAGREGQFVSDPLVITAPMVVRGEVTSTVKVTADNADKVTDQDAVSVEIGVLGMVLSTEVVDHDESGDLTAGDEVLLTGTVFNIGDVPLLLPKLAGPGSGGFIRDTSDLADPEVMAVDEGIRFSGRSYTVTGGDADAGSVTLTVSATSCLESAGAVCVPADRAVTDDSVTLKVFVHEPNPTPTPTPTDPTPTPEPTPTPTPTPEPTPTPTPTPTETPDPPKPTPEPTKTPDPPGPPVDPTYPPDPPDPVDPTPPPTDPVTPTDPGKPPVTPIDRPGDSGSYEPFEPNDTTQPESPTPTPEPTSTDMPTPEPTGTTWPTPREPGDPTSGPSEPGDPTTPPAGDGGLVWWLPALILGPLVIAGGWWLIGSRRSAAAAAGGDEDYDPFDASSPATGGAAGVTAVFDTASEPTEAFTPVPPPAPAAAEPPVDLDPSMPDDIFLPDSDASGEPPADR